jgi:hypothetical protein
MPLPRLSPAGVRKAWPRFDFTGPASTSAGIPRSGVDSPNGDHHHRWEHDQPYEWSLPEMEAPRSVGAHRCRRRPASQIARRPGKPEAPSFSSRHGHKVTSETYARALKLFGAMKPRRHSRPDGAYAGTAANLTAPTSDAATDEAIPAATLHAAKRPGPESRIPVVDPAGPPGRASRSASRDWSLVSRTRWPRRRRAPGPDGWLGSLQVSSRRRPARGALRRLRFSSRRAEHTSSITDAERALRTPGFVLDPAVIETGAWIAEAARVW